MSKKLISAVAAATLGAAALSTPAHAEFSSTAGLVSDYVFRGLASGDAAANASIDFDADNGFTAGVWAIDLGNADGLEFDVYAAYGMDMDSWNWSLGATTYQLTESTLSQNEVNIGLGAGDFSLAVDLGNIEDSANSAVDIDTTHYALTWAVNDVYSLTVGQTDPDAENDDAVNPGSEDDEWVYLDITAAGEVSDIDVALTLGAVDEGDVAPNMNGYLVLSASKTFDGLGF